MINNSTKLKNSTANALSSPYAVVFFFCFFENAKYVRYSSFSRKRLILTDFDRLSSAFFFLMDSPVILEFSVKYIFFSRSASIPYVFVVTNMFVSSEKMYLVYFKRVMTINAVRKNVLNGPYVR